MHQTADLPESYDTTVAADHLITLVAVLVAALVFAGIVLHLAGQKDECLAQGDTWVNNTCTSEERR